ncbi:VOC family protein [Egbenema bharatensis]|uniref:VOC family protein n=1 Tax=Egbenema bharatensis TaxID=3463334 RepID=UPI003A872027
MHITRYLHTAILVTDLEQAMHFYSTVLGLEKVDRPLKYPGVWYQLGEIQVHLIVDELLPRRVGVGSGSSRLHNPEKWGRNPHLALGVDNLEAAKAHLMAHNCPIQLSASGRSALFTQDPDGNVVELTQIPTEAGTPSNASR